MDLQVTRWVCSGPSPLLPSLCSLSPPFPLDVLQGLPALALPYSSSPSTRPSSLSLGCAAGPACPCPTLLILTEHAPLFPFPWMCCRACLPLPYLTHPHRACTPPPFPLDVLQGLPVPALSYSSSPSTCPPMHDALVPHAPCACPNAATCSAPSVQAHSPLIRGPCTYETL